jgi:hypothetical protein
MPFGEVPTPPRRVYFLQPEVSGSASTKGCLLGTTVALWTTAHPRSASPPRSGILSEGGHFTATLVFGLGEIERSSKGLGARPPPPSTTGGSRSEGQKWPYLFRAGYTSCNRRLVGSATTLWSDNG